MKYQFPFAVDAHCLKCSRYYAAPPAFGVKCESRGKGGRNFSTGPDAWFRDKEPIEGARV